MFGKLGPTVRLMNYYVSLSWYDCQEFWAMWTCKSDVGMIAMELHFNCWRGFTLERSWRYEKICKYSLWQDTVLHVIYLCLCACKRFVTNNDISWCPHWNSYCSFVDSTVYDRVVYITCIVFCGNSFFIETNHIFLYEIHYMAGLSD